MSDQLINTTVEFVKETLKEAEGGHDWWHIYRVWKTTIHIATKEKANLLVAQLGALLHDIADSKFHNGDETIGPKLATDFLVSQNVSPETINAVQYSIKYISFKGGFNKIENPTIELQVVQDADRLDAIGAIGIARTFNYGGFKNRPLYNPNIPPEKYTHKEAYKLNNAPTINHFYEKLLLLKDTMNTKTGRLLAEERHQFMLSYLEQFYKEWEGEE